MPVSHPLPPRAPPQPAGPPGRDDRRA